MKRGSWATNRYILDGASLNGVITRRALRQCGVSDGSITLRTGSGGKWRRILPGIILLHNGSPTLLQQQSAALLYGGGQCMLTGGAAVMQHGFDRVGGDVHILVPATMRRAPSSFVRVERTHRLPEPLHRGRLAVAPLPRALVDTARALRNTGACTRLFAEAIQRGAVDLDEIVRELKDGPRRYGAAGWAAASELADDAHSVAEVQAQRLYSTSGLPKMVHNRDVLDADGRFLGRPDGWIDAVGFGWQIDSFAHHLSPADHAKTLKRRADMERIGIVIVAHLPKQIRDDPTGVLDDLRAGYARALARPRPPVHIAQA
ncbi:hypothetical protein [Rhodococcus sp. BP22]|uniref:hypothetical protein n=1 Tax=Rhodococcus sp. BP22 TaxID=2758566 RepID=UPI001648AD07|nr:hypothetical protein [Rhodococcus sp. BP22]